MAASCPATTGLTIRETGGAGSQYAEGNLLRDQRRGGGQAWTYRGPGGAAGGDGECTYFNDSDTGGPVMTGGC
jgi:hypothetical protein